MSRAKHILMLLSNGYTNDPRVRNETRSLTAAGYQVTVVAWDRDGTMAPEEQIDGARIVRVTNSPWMATLRLDLLRLRGWWRLAARAAMTIHQSDPIDVVHAHDLDTLPSGCRLKERLRVPLVYDAHEIWGYMLSRDVPFALASWFLLKEARLAKCADRIITVNQTLQERLERLAPSVPVVLVQNARPLEKAGYVAPPEGELIVLYVGRLNSARFILESIEALRDVPGVRLIVAGAGKPDYVRKVEAAAEQAPNVTFLGPVPNDTVMERTRNAHVVLHMLDPSDRNNRIASGNKQFEAMAAGRPIICTEGTNDGRIAREEGHGLVVPFDKDALREAIVRLRDDPALRDALGRKALAAGEREYNWAAQEARLLGMYRGLLPN